MTRPYVTTRRQWLAHGALFGAAGFLWGALATIVVLPRINVQIIDPLMEAACIFPKREGESLIAVILNDQLKCWRNK